MDLPFFRYWPVLLEMSYPSSLEWRRRLNMKNIKLRKEVNLTIDQEALARVKLEKDPKVQIALHRWWIEMVLENKKLSKVQIEGSALSKTKYLEIHQKLLEVLTHEVVDEKDAKIVAEDDWDNDSNGKNGIYRKTFVSMVFELAWLFVGDSDVKDYLAFLNAICTTCTGIELEETTPAKRKSLSDRYNDDLNKWTGTKPKESNPPVERINTTGSVVNLLKEDANNQNNISGNVKPTLYHPPKAKKTWTKRVKFTNEYQEIQEAKFLHARNNNECNDNVKNDNWHMYNDDHSTTNGNEGENDNNPAMINGTNTQQANQIQQEMLTALENLHWSHVSIQKEVIELKKVKYHNNHVDEMYKTMGIIEKKLSNEMTKISKQLEQQRRKWEEKQRSVLIDMKVSNEALLKELNRQSEQNRLQKSSTYNHKYHQYSPIKKSTSMNYIHNVETNIHKNRSLNYLPDVDNTSPMSRWQHDDNEKGLGV